jgi:transcriptional regulator GlxA family with amidase domain
VAERSVGMTHVVQGVEEADEIERSTRELVGARHFEVYPLRKSSGLLVLYLIARMVGRTAAQAIANVFALQWHRDGLGPYVVFNGNIQHADRTIAEAQRWLKANYATPDPLAEATSRSGLAERTFKRRFQEATKHSPLAYVQLLRVEDAKRRLERTDTSIETIAWQVGYEDAAFFRRLFKRLTGVSPGHYRRRFGMPPDAGSD